MFASRLARTRSGGLALGLAAAIGMLMSGLLVVAALAPAWAHGQDHDATSQGAYRQPSEAPEAAGPGAGPPAESGPGASPPGAGTEGPQPDQPQGPVVQVEIRGFAFAQAELKIEAGTTVVWRNADAAPHTVTSLQEPRTLDSPLLTTGMEYRFTFTAPGRYEYYCTLHPTMRAVVIVQ